MVTQRESTRTPAPSLALDVEALHAARHAPLGKQDVESARWRQELITLLNGALATELVCVLRYKRHHFTARGMSSPRIAEEFAVHAAEEMVHADRLARRISQLGGQPDFNPETLMARSHATYDEHASLPDMISADLAAERVAIESYGQMIQLVGALDPTTRRLLEDILADEQKHADELDGWLRE